MKKLMLVFLLSSYVAFAKWGKWELKQFPNDKGQICNPLYVSNTYKKKTSPVISIYQKASSDEDKPGTRVVGKESYCLYINFGNLAKITDISIPEYVFEVRVDNNSPIKLSAYAKTKELFSEDNVKVGILVEQMKTGKNLKVKINNKEYKIPLTNFSNVIKEIDDWELKFVKMY
ncbi:hypothetical protein [Fusobacterium sp. PH5-44]|uniref:hypothetical protein n=1 Tax=unclassified Fusobacterium TaxID=2648384 RepID=UPI003D227BD7